MARAAPQQARRFDLREELRATAHRRRPPGAGSGGYAAGQEGDLASFSVMRAGGVADIAARLATMFPSLPQDTIQGVLSELFRASPHCSREELADAAVNALLDMGVAGGTGGDAPQSITCFSPRASGPRAEEEGVDPALIDVDAAEAADQEGPNVVLDEAGDACMDDFDELFDASLAGVLGLPEDSISACVQTLCAVLDRIAQDPGNLKVRRLRMNNAKFQQAIGQHEPAIELLAFAGFEDDHTDIEDPAKVFRPADPSTCPNFDKVREAMHSIAEDLKFDVTTGACGTPSTGSSPVPVAPRSKISAVERADRRSRIAALTEQRLQNPAVFREQAKRRGAGNRITGGIVRRPRQAHDEAPQAAAAPNRRAQHFTLSDVERMRVVDEIANTPSYADEYRRNAHSSAARDYGTLVSRTYDAELIAREALDGTNKYRASKGLPPLRWNDGIARIAREHAESMASGAAPFSHDGFDARVRAFPLAHRASAENLAYSHGISAVAQCAVDGWIKSPGHEKNLRGQYNVCGIGVGRSPQGAFYTTQLFAQAT